MTNKIKSDKGDSSTILDGGTISQRINEMKVFLGVGENETFQDIIMNLYCKKINQFQDYAIYSFGVETKNLSGKVKFKCDCSYNIIKQPDGDYVTEAEISFLLEK